MKIRVFKNYFFLFVTLIGISCPILADETVDLIKVFEKIGFSTQHTSPQNLFLFNDVVYFSAEENEYGRELWRTDGTQKGTYLVKNINISPMITNRDNYFYGGSNEGSSDPSDFTEINGTIYFTATTGTINYDFIHNINLYNGRELWKTDGTTNGTVLVKDIWPGTKTIWVDDPEWITGKRPIAEEANSALPKNLTKVSDTLFFSAEDQINGRELWKSNGTEEGTILVTDINPGIDANDDPFSSNPRQLSNVNEVLFFVADNPNGTYLWTTDGTEIGTIKLAAISSNSYNFVHINGILYFVSDDESHGTELWVSDGTSEGTRIFMDINNSVNDENQPNGSSPYNLTNYNDILFFTANDGNTGTELWKSNGTPEGTVRVKDIYPGNHPGYPIANSSMPRYLTVVGDVLYFVASDGIAGLELWKTDGTEIGTQMVADIKAGPSNSGITKLYNINNKLYFSNYEGLWKSDGSTNGTKYISYTPFDPSEVTFANGKFLIVGHIGGVGRRLLAYDPTISFGRPTHELIISYQSTSHISELTYVNDLNLFFVGTDSQHGEELWKTDGTVTGTELVKDIMPLDIRNSWKNDGSHPRHLTNVNGILYFVAKDKDHGRELWKSDGTLNGTAIVKDIFPGDDVTFLKPRPNSSNPRNLAQANGVLYFSANDGVNGDELWRSDGTEQGTVLVKDFTPGLNSDGVPLSSNISFIKYINNTLYVQTMDTTEIGYKRYTLWRSIDLAAGIFSDVDRINTSDYPVIGNYYVSHREVCTLDLVNCGPGAANYSHTYVNYWGDAILINDSLFYHSRIFVPNANVIDRWGNAIVIDRWESGLAKMDGTLSGSKVFAYPSAFPNGPDSPESLTVVNNWLYFSASTPDQGRELWRSDGTAGGTFLFADINPSQNMGSLRGFGSDSFIGVYNTLYFVANDGIHGRELWKSDGTPASTNMLFDLNPGDNQFSNPTDLIMFKGELFFLANNPQGRGLWRYKLDLDNDGFSNTYEDTIGSDRGNSDSDNDGIVDGFDPCPLEPFTENCTLTGRNEHYYSTEDHRLNIYAPGVLENEMESNLVASLLTNPIHGDLIFRSDGSFQYDSDSNYCGEDSFTYTVENAQVQSGPISAYIHIACINDPPIAIDQTLESCMGEPLQITLSAYEPDNDPMRYSFRTFPRNGELVYSSSSKPDLIYKPNPGFVGRDDFTFIATETDYTGWSSSGLSSEGDITIFNLEIPILTVEPKEMDLGSLGGEYTKTTDINDFSHVVGISKNALDEHRVFIINPEDTNSDGVVDLWYRDYNFDGINDLMIDLGKFSASYNTPTINNVGQIVLLDRPNAYVIGPLDSDNDGNPDTWYQDDNNDGINDLMINLGVLYMPGEEIINDAGQIITKDFSGTEYIILPKDNNYDGIADVWFEDLNLDGINDLMSEIGHIGANFINNNGVVAGSIIVRGETQSYRHALVLVPENIIGNSLPDQWFHDENADGKNDLIIDLGPMMNYFMHSPVDINDNGQIIGGGYPPASSTKLLYIVNPKDVDNDGKVDTWFLDENDDGTNDLMTILGNFHSTTDRSAFINNRGEVVWNQAYNSTYLVRPEDTDGDGESDQWYKDLNGDAINDLITDFGSIRVRGQGSVFNDLGQLVGIDSSSWPDNNSIIISPEHTNCDGIPDSWIKDVDNNGVNDLSTNLGDLGYYSATLNNQGQIIGSKGLSSFILANTINHEPVFQDIAPITIDENVNANFMLKANDPDRDALTFSASLLPVGAEFNSETGMFSWTPTYFQSGQYHIDFSVSDGEFTVTQSVSVLVRDVPDIDFDGIYNEIDLGPYVYSLKFSDIYSPFLQEVIGGSTNGEILYKGGQNLTIKDEPSPYGVRIESNEFSGEMWAFISLCNGSSKVLITAKDSVIATCGSAIIDVLSGTVEVTFVAESGVEATVDLTENNSLTFDPITETFTAPATNTEVAVITVADKAVEVAPGETVKSVDIDIKPDSSVNNINLGANGTIPVAILTTPNFDATTVELNSVTLSGSALNIIGKAKYQAAFEDVDNDGDTDLLLHIVNELNLAEGETTAILKGMTKSGISIQGQDLIRIVP